MDKWYFGVVGDGDKARERALTDVLRALPRGEGRGTVACRITGGEGRVIWLGDVRGALEVFARTCARSVKDLAGGLAYADYLHGVEDLRGDFLRCVRGRMRETEKLWEKQTREEDRIMTEVILNALDSAFWATTPEGFCGSYRWAAECAVCAVMCQLMARGEEYGDAVRQLEDQQREWLGGY